MTKNEMIRKIKENEEHHWKLLVSLTREFGENSIQAERQRARWATINVLCGELGIEV